VRVLEDAGEAMTRTEVAESPNKNVNTIKFRLWRMSNDGQFSSDGGRYRLDSNPGISVTEE